MQNNANNPDRIAEFYKNSTILITGGSGFLGKITIEKLFRSCCDIKQIYLLLRTKRDKSPNERIKEIFNNPLFDQLKQQQPNCQQKCKAIAGDVSEIALGLSDADRNRLQRDVDVIIHAAATTRFDNTVREALIVNTRGTKFMLDLAGGCSKLRVFVHMSTAYVFPNEDQLYERSYRPPVDPHDALSAINWIAEDEGGVITKILLKDMPNTYTLSKSLAEALVVEKMSEIPAIILRPSVVIPIWKEPLKGWCNNLQGPMGLFVGAGKGIIRSMYVNGNATADFLPADVVVNGIIVSTWYFATINRTQRFYHLTSSNEYRFTWEEIIELGKNVCLTTVPFNGVVWYPGGSLKRSKLQHELAFYLFQLLPAIIIDCLLVLFGYKPVLYQIQRRIQKGGKIYEFYTTKNWQFDNKYALICRKQMNDNEKLIYKIDGAGFEMREYFIHCIRAVRRNILKESDDMLPAAKRNLKIMWAVDKSVKLLLLFAFFYYCYVFLSHF